MTRACKDHRLSLLYKNNLSKLTYLAPDPDIVQRPGECICHPCWLRQLDPAAPGGTAWIYRDFTGFVEGKGDLARDF